MKKCPIYIEIIKHIFAPKLITRQSNQPYDPIHIPRTLSAEAGIDWNPAANLYRTPFQLLEYHILGEEGG